MKILFLDWECFGRLDSLEAFKKMGHEIKLFFHEDYYKLENEAFKKAFYNEIKNGDTDLCFSYNYYPLMAECCKDENIPYVSFVYDSPYTLLYSYTLIYPTNHVFLFDSSWVEEFRQGGITNVYYMNLPGNASKIDGLIKRTYDKKRLSSDVSFVGAFYKDEHDFYERLVKKAPKYLAGYLEGIVEAQQKVYGYSLVEELLTDEIVGQMRDVLDARANSTSAEPPKYRYSNYFIKRQITQRERIRLMELVGERFGKEYDIKLFTNDKNYKIHGVQNMGRADYIKEMPYVFYNSKINLNISLRSIQTGVPLRCMDIMASGGFLLSNYQSDLFIDFIPGEEFDYFESPEDMASKIEYYLSHEKERCEMAKNGREKVANYFSFEKVFQRIFDMVGVG